MKKLFSLCAMLTGFILSNAALAQTAPDVEDFRYNLYDQDLLYYSFPTEGVEVGQGWDSVLGRKTQSHCVLGQVNEIKNDSTSINFQLLMDKEQLYRALSVAASASYNGGAVKGSASSSFVENSRIENSRTYILGTVIAEKGGVTIVPAGTWSSLAQPKPQNAQAVSVKLAAGPAKALKRSMAEFRSICGDAFVISIRTGARLDVLFENINRTSEFNQAFGFTASVKSATASAKVSMNKSKMEQLANSSQSVRTIQIGGDQTSDFLNEDPAKAAPAIIGKIAQFAKFERDRAIPYQAIVMPYRYLPGWPQDRLFEGTSSQEILITKGLHLRYAALAELYTDAAVNPHSYYNPFLADQADLLKKARILQSASVCLEGVVAYCTLNTGCNMTDMLSPSKIERTCPVFSNLPDEPSRTFAKLFATPQASWVSTNKSANLKTMPLTTNAQMAIAEGASTIDATTKLPLPREWLYYELMARAPLVRKVGTPSKPEGIAPGDELLAIQAYCTEVRGAGSCPEIDYKEMEIDRSSSADPAVIAEETRIRHTVQNWLLVSRLHPLSASFCAESNKHPMCLSALELASISATVDVKTGELHGFFKSSVSPPPPPPSAPTTANEISRSA